MPFVKKKSGTHFAYELNCAISLTSLG